MHGRGRPSSLIGWFRLPICYSFYKHEYGSGLWCPTNHYEIEIFFLFMSPLETIFQVCFLHAVPVGVRDPAALLVTRFVNFGLRRGSVDILFAQQYGHFLGLK